MEASSFQQKMIKFILPFIFSAILLTGCSSGSKPSEKNTTDSLPKERPARIYTTPQTVQAQQAGPGKLIFEENCLACHQAAGEGVPGMIPPLNRNEFTTNKEKLISTVLHGVEGPITVNGTEYNNIMPAQDYMSDEDIAEVLTYILKTFVHSDDQITTEEVAAISNEK